MKTDPYRMEALGMFVSSVHNGGRDGRVLEIGGTLDSEKALRGFGLDVDSIDFSRHRITYEARPPRPDRYIGVFASHVLEHSPNPGDFIRKMMMETKARGVIGIIVPPMKPQIVGGHLTLWNAGLLLYHLVRAGLDCSGAAVRTAGYNVCVITRKLKRPYVPLRHGGGDINALAEYFPLPVEEGFDGNISELNWKPV